MRRIRELLDPVPVADGAGLGVDVDAKEALAFAVLAWAHLRDPRERTRGDRCGGAPDLGSFTPGAYPPRVP